MEPITYSIVRKSNFNHEDWRGDQYFVAQGIPTKVQADIMAEALNDNEHEHSDDWFVVVDSRYTMPPKWEP